MRIIVDFETQCSGADLKKVGGHNYVKHPTFTPLCLCWLVLDEEGQIVDTGDCLFPDGNRDLPDSLDQILEYHPDAEFWAWNAAFDRLVWNEVFPSHRKGRVWRCAMTFCLYNGMPTKAGGVLSLKDAARFLNLEQQKGSINFKKLPPMRDILEYCHQDVRVTAAVINAMPLRWIDRELALSDFSDAINERGFPFDALLASRLESLTQSVKDWGSEVLAEGTDGVVTSPNQKVRFLNWARSFGIPLDSTSKSASFVPRNAFETKIASLMSVLQGSSPSSMSKAVSGRLMAHNGRIRLAFQAYGASRTGRFSGRGFQPQNLPRVESSVRDRLSELRSHVVEKGELPAFVVDNKVNAIKSLLRTLIKPSVDNGWIASFDYSGIEARVLSYLAGNAWAVDSYRRGDDLYVKMAASIFGVPLQDVTGSQRHLGKIAVLGCGYGMGAARFLSQMTSGGVENASESLATRAVNTYRNKNPKIVSFWESLHQAAIRSIIHAGKSVRIAQCPVPLKFRFCSTRKMLFIALPSGRILTSWGVERDKASGQIGRVQSLSNGDNNRVNVYGGLLAENVVQALSRDVMVDALLRLPSVWKGVRSNPEEKGVFSVIGTVHDEIMIEIHSSRELAEKVCGYIKGVMEKDIDWAPGLPISVEYSLGGYYGK